MYTVACELFLCMSTCMATVCETASLTEYETYCDRLARQQGPGIFLSQAPQNSDYRRVVQYPAFYKSVTDANLGPHNYTASTLFN